MAVWKSYPALHEHFIRKSTDATLDGREKSKFAGLAKKLASTVFVKNLGLMLDALEELADLFLALQRDDVTLSSATKVISKQVAVFSARASNVCSVCSAFNAVFVKLLWPLVIRAVLFIAAELA